MKMLWHFAILFTAIISQTWASKCSDHLHALKADGWSNYDDTTKSSYDPQLCTAVYSNFEKHVHQVHGLINEHLKQSLVYSIMASHFNTDFQNRLGFAKYMGELSSSMWEDAIGLIKYVGLRGSGVAPLSDASKPSGLKVTDLTADIGSWSEIEALGLALDNHQELAVKVHHLHSSTKDSALVGFLEQRFTGKHAERIRELAGYLTNLVPMVEEVSGKEMALYLFDQKLA